MNTSIASPLHRHGLVAFAAAGALTLALGAPLAVPTPAYAQAGGSQAMITPNYKDADLGQIVEAVSQVTGKNFIIDPRVKANVTMLSATPMSADAFYEAFLAILQVHGFVAVPAGKIIKIIPDANARQVPANDLPDRVSSTSDEIVTQVVMLKSVSAAQLVPILRPLIPQYGHLAAYPASNALIISDRANNVNRMLRIIQRIDQASDDEVEFIKLENASASELVRVVNGLNQAAGAEGGGAQVKLVADERTNSVLMSGEKSARLRLRTLIAHLDTPLESGGDTQVRYLKYADAEKIAQKLKEQLQGATQGQGQAAQGAQAAQEKSTVIWADPATNALVVTAPPKLMRNLMSVVDRLDIRRAQVLVEAIIVEVRGSKNSDLGINWLIDGSKDNIAAGGFVAPLDSKSTNIGTIIAAAQDPSSIDPSVIPTGVSIGIGRIKDTGTNFAALIRAIRDDGNTNIISTPSTVTLDNQEAQIKVAQEVPFLTGSFASTGAGTGGGNNGVVNPFQTIQRQDVGTILKITPQITDDNNVMMKIEVEASSLAASSGSAVDLITNKRTITTNVLSTDGEIIVLGGLISDELREGETRVPLLGRLPLLGNLFKTRTTAKTKTNLMIFIRPKVLLDSEAIATETGAKYNYLRELQRRRNKGKAQLLPGERQPTLPALEELSPNMPQGLPKANSATGIVPGSGAPPAPPQAPASPNGPPQEAPAAARPSPPTADAAAATEAPATPAEPAPGAGAPVIVTPGAAANRAPPPPPAQERN